jgi:TolA-binding protein
MFNKRMAQDRKKYSTQQLREAEQLYQVANKDWRTPQARESLKTMIEKYPDVNRTGCAVLYLGQMSEGADGEEFLTRAIEKHADCMYGDGVIVGAYARFLLAQHYAAADAKDKARRLFSEILRQYPDAIDHNQAPLAPQVEVYMNDL